MTQYTVTYASKNGAEKNYTVQHNGNNMYFELAHLADPREADIIQKNDKVTLEMTRGKNGKPWVRFKSVKLAKRAVVNINKEKSNLAKSKFIEFMNSLGRAFIAVDKSPENYSTAFNSPERNKSIHSPDFFVCNVGIGTVGVDVMNRSHVPRAGKQCVRISKSEYLKSLQFHREFCTPWWWCNYQEGMKQNETPFTSLSLFDFDEFYQEERGKENSPFIDDNNGFIYIPVERCQPGF